MLKTILTTTLLLATLVGRGQSKPKRSDTANFKPHRHTTQKQVYMPDCDSTFWRFNPCKVKLYKNNKLIGYSVQNIHLNITSAANYDFSGTRDSFGMNQYKNYHYIQFTGKWGNWWIDSPDTTGKIKIHIQRKQLQFINDTTAIYTPTTK